MHRAIFNGRRAARRSGAVATAATTHPVLTAAGELDLAAAPGLWQRASSALARGATRLTLDLSAVTFMDVSGLRAVVGVADRAADAGCEVKVIKPAGPANRVFDLLFDAMQPPHGLSVGIAA